MSFTYTPSVASSHASQGSRGTNLSKNQPLTHHNYDDDLMKLQLTKQNSNSGLFSSIATDKQNINNNNNNSTSTQSFLSHRWSIWMSLSASSIISSSSISAVVPPNDRTPVDIASVSLTCISAIIAALVSLSFLHGPSRDFMTKDNFEFMTSIFLLTLWSASLYLIMDENHQLGVDEDGSIWDPNLFFSTWLAFSLDVYLVADLLTIDDRSGLLPCHYTPNNTIRKGWIYVLIASIVFLAFALATAAGGVCSNTSDVESYYGIQCDYIYLTAGLAVMGIVISIFSFVLNRQWQMNKMNDESLAKYGAILAFASLLSSTVNIPVTTANNGAGSNSGSLFFLCWGCFGLSLRMCLRYMEVFKNPSSDASVGHYTGSITASRRSSFSSYNEEEEGNEAEEDGATLYLSDDNAESYDDMSQLGASQRSILKIEEQKAALLESQRSRSKSPSSLSGRVPPPPNRQNSQSPSRKSRRSSRSRERPIKMHDPPQHSVSDPPPEQQSQGMYPPPPPRRQHSGGSSKKSKSSSKRHHKNNDPSFGKSQEWFNQSGKIGEGPPTISPHASSMSLNYDAHSEQGSSSRRRRKSSKSPGGSRSSRMTPPVEDFVSSSSESPPSTISPDGEGYFAC